MSVRNLGKFIDPCDWDAQWVVTDEMVCFLREEPQNPSQRDSFYAKFTEPRSWALKWDGLAVFEADAKSIFSRA